MVQFETEDEKDHVLDILKYHKADSIWIGASKLSGQFKWKKNGEKIKYEDDIEWFPGKNWDPNTNTMIKIKQTYDDENCLTLDNFSGYAFYFNTGHCDNRKNFICESLGEWTYG